MAYAMGYKRKRKIKGFRRKSRRKTRPYSRKKYIAKIPRQRIRTDFVMTKFHVEPAIADIWKMSAGLTPFAQVMVFSLDQAQGAGDLSRHFERYKINAITVCFKPRKATVVNLAADDAKGQLADDIPEAYYMSDFNDTIIPSTGIEDWFRGHRRTKILKANRTYKKTFKPRCLQPFYGFPDAAQPGGVNNNYRTISSPWCDLNEANESIQTQHFGLKTGLQACAQISTWTLVPEVTYYVSFAGRRPL